MSDHEPTSLKSPEHGDGQCESNVSDSGSTSKSPATPKLKHQKSGLSRAIQSLLTAPQSASTASIGRSTSRGRAPRSPVEPFIPSPLRISSTMASAPSSPERAKADAEDQPRRSLDQLPNEAGRASAGDLVGGDESSNSDLISPVQSASKKRRERMAAVMSGLESRLLPKSFTRGRERGRNISPRGSSLDSRSPSSGFRFGRSLSPGRRFLHSSPSKPTVTERGTAIKMDDAHNKSDEALAKPAGSLPDYVKPSEHEGSGERLAKDVFDRDKNIIESSDEDSGNSSDDVSLDEGRKEKANLYIITPSDYDDKSPRTSEEERM